MPTKKLTHEERTNALKERTEMVKAKTTIREAVIGTQRCPKKY